MEIKLKLSQPEQIVKDHLLEIAYINNLDSDNLLESLQMILDKGLESELIHETDLTCNKCIDLVKYRLSFRNHCQRRFEKIVRSEILNSELAFRSPLESS